MGRIEGFRDLIVYQRARVEAHELFLLSKKFGAEEKYSLTDQIRRSSRAVGAMIAEAWARRRYKAAFVSKLNEALGEAMETQAWLDYAMDCGYLTAQEHEARDEQWRQIGAMLAGMIEKADSFCDS